VSLYPRKSQLSACRLWEESFKFFNQKTDSGAVNSEHYWDEEKDQEESTETQDGTIQAEWNF
jgi:hypothetical protein